MARTKIEEYDIEKLNEKGLTISEINKLFVSSFPDSFGFKVYRPKKGTRVFDLQPDYDTDGYYGINDENLRLSFDKFHSLNYKVHQGDENTSFYFVLDGNDNQSYIGTFGFKDRGDVPKEYVTEFIAFLHKIYNFPFKVSHEVYKDGGGVDYYNFDKKMALINLNQIHEYSIKLDNLVSEDTQLEEWVKMKLTRIEQNVADVKKSIQGWEKFEGFGDGGRIFKKQLLHIAKYANDLIEMIKSGSKLMSWQENKLAISAEYIDGIYHHLDYKMGNRASDIEYAKGGGINSGRDKLFKSQEPHEQAYKRKREWKEYKKEGWFGDWFKDGGKIYSSDDLYVMNVYKGGTNELLTSKNFRAKNQKEANEIVEYEYEDSMKNKYGDYLKFEVKPVEKMKNGGGVMEKLTAQTYTGKDSVSGDINEIAFYTAENGTIIQLVSVKDGSSVSGAMYYVTINGRGLYAREYREDAYALYRDEVEKYKSKYANGGDIKTDFNELENTKLRNVLISFWNDFFNSNIYNYLSIEKDNYILSNVDNVFVIVRDKDKGNFSYVEKEKIDIFLSPYFDSSKKPLFSEFFVRYEIKDNKIIIHIKERNMYSNGGGVGEEMLYYVVGKKNKQLVEISTDSKGNITPMTKQDAERFAKDMESNYDYNSIDIIPYRGKNTRVKYAKGGGVQNILTLPKSTIDEIKNSVRMGYNVVRVGMISPKRKGVVLTNDEYEVRGTYPLEYKEFIEQIVEGKYAKGGGVEYSSEISKQQLESMVGRSLNGWNDDVVYHNGEKYKKCFLRPYYKKQ